MRRLLGTLFVLTVLSLSPVKGQTIIQGSDTIGVQMLDSTAIVAPYIDFGRPVYSIFTSPQNDYMLIMFRKQSKNGEQWKNTGDIGMFRLSDMRLTWTKPFNYATSSVILTSKGVIKIEKNIVTFLSKVSGTTLWQHSFSPVLTDDSLGIILGYSNGITSNRLHAYSIDTGEELWSQKVSRDYNWGWDNVVRNDPQHCIVACDRLTRLNLLTGEKQEYHSKTGVTDVKSLLLEALVATAGALAGAAVSRGAGYYCAPVYGNQVITGLHSNIWQTDGSIFFSDREHVVRLDSLLQPEWELELPRKTATRSLLVSDDSLLYQFSFGVGYRGGSVPVKMGRPFIAAFSKETGEQQFINLLSMKKTMVNDAVITPRCTYMMFDDAMAYKSDLCDSTVSIVPWDEQQYGKLRQIMQDTVYIYYPLQQTFLPYAFDGQNCPVMTDRGDVYIVNERLDIWQRFANEQLFFPLKSKGDRRLIYHSYPQPELVLIQELGMPEARYFAEFSHLSITDKHLYMIVGNRLFFLDY